MSVEPVAITSRWGSWWNQKINNVKNSLRPKILTSAVNILQNISLSVIKLNQREVHGPAITVQPTHSARLDITSISLTSNAPLTYQQEIKLASMRAEQPDNAQLEALYHAVYVRQLSRNKYNADALKGLDLINFALLQEYLIKMNEVFHRSNFQQSAHSYAELRLSPGSLDPVDPVAIDKWMEVQLGDVLTKTLAYMQDIDEYIIQIPTRTPDGIKLIPYRIQALTVGDHMPAYLLVPTIERPTTKPWLIFRGTSIMTNTNEQGQELRDGTLESIQADTMEKGGVAGSVMRTSTAHEAPFRQALDAALLEEEKIIVSGHSLGGYLAQSFMLYLPRRVDSLYTYSSPGPREEELSILEHLSEQHRPYIQNCTTKGDTIPSIGGPSVGHTIEITRKDGSDVPGVIHIDLSFTNSTYIMQAVDSELERSKFARWVAKKAQRACGRLLAFFTPTTLLPTWLQV